MLSRAEKLARIDRLIRETKQLITDVESFNDFNRKRMGWPPIVVVNDREALSILKKIRGLIAQDQPVPAELFDRLEAVCAIPKARDNASR